MVISSLTPLQPREFGHVTRVVEHVDWKEGLFYTRTSDVAALLHEALDQCQQALAN